MDPVAPAAPSTASARPLAAMLAVVLLLVIAFGAVGFGALALLVGSELGLGNMETAVLVTGAAGLVYGVTAIGGAVGLWRGRGWGWVLAMVVAVIGLLSTVIGAATSGFQLPLLVGIGMFAVLALCLLDRRVRTRAGAA